MDVDVVGEVIEATTTDITGESRELHSPPAFGSFVKVVSNGVAASTARVIAPATSLDEEEDPFESLHRAAGSFNREFRQAVGGEPAGAPGPKLQPAVYAIVYQAGTGPVDPSRRLRAFWKDEEPMRDEHPELSEWLLVTRFQAITIGHSLDGSVQQILPPQPPKLFSQVRTCSKSEIRQITSRLDFLRTLVNSRNAPTEEVIAACILQAYDAHNNDFNFLVAAGKELAGVLKDDYDRLQAVIRRVAPC
jgi:hypothetical protein